MLEEVNVLNGFNMIEYICIMMRYSQNLVNLTTKDLINAMGLEVYDPNLSQLLLGNLDLHCLYFELIREQHI